MSAIAEQLGFSSPHVLRNDDEYDAAVAGIDHLLDLDPAPGTSEHEMLEFLTVLVRAYDEEHYPMGDESTPQDIVDFTLEQRGMDRSDLNGVLGGRSRVSEFFAGKRRLSITQIIALKELLNIPADLLIEASPSNRG